MPPVLSDPAFLNLLILLWIIEDLGALPSHRRLRRRPAVRCLKPIASVSPLPRKHLRAWVAVCGPRLTVRLQGHSGPQVIGTSWPKIIQIALGTIVWAHVHQPADQLHENSFALDPVSFHSAAAGARFLSSHLPEHHLSSPHFLRFDCAILALTICSVSECVGRTCHTTGLGGSPYSDSLRASTHEVFPAIWSLAIPALLYDVAQPSIVFAVVVCPSR